MGEATTTEERGEEMIAALRRIDPTRDWAAVMADADGSRVDVEDVVDALIAAGCDPDRVRRSLDVDALRREISTIP